RRLAGRPGDRDQGPGPRSSVRTSERAQRDPAIADDDGGHIDRHRTLDHDRARTRRHRGRAESMSVVSLTADRHVEVAWRGDPAVDHHPADAGRFGSTRGFGGARGFGFYERAAGVDRELGDRAALAEGDRGGGLLPVVEMVLGGAEDLVVLVTLAGDHDDVARDSLADRGADRAGAVDVDGERPRHAVEDLLDD